jgi:hypothetical protein
MKILFLVSLLLTFVFPGHAATSVSLENGEELEIPVRVIPSFVDVTRWTDLLATANLKNEPVNLSEYPLLEFQDISAMELELRDSENSTTLVKIGSVASLPEMVSTSIDLHKGMFSPKTTPYKIARRLGIGTDEKWRYATSDRSKIENIENGIVRCSFDSGGFIAFQKYMSSHQLSKAPWLYYEYEIPLRGVWFIVVSGKIRKPGFLGETIPITSGPVWGAGKKAIGVNLFKLLKESDPNAKDGYLEELNIHYFLAENGQSPQRGISLDLGKINFVKGVDGDNPKVIYLPVEQSSGRINLHGAIENLFPDQNKFELVGVRVKKNQDSAKVVLKTDFQERTPELFIGDAFIANELRPDELSAVLDQKLFIEKKALWESGRSDVVFRKTGAQKEAVVSYSLNLNLQTTPDVDNYLLCDFLNEVSRDNSLVLTLSGLNKLGKQVNINHRLTRGQPVKLSDLKQLTKLALSFGETAASVLINKIQISQYKKTSVFKPVKELAVVGMTRLGNALFQAGYEKLIFNLQLNDDLQSIKNFGVGSPLVADYFIQYELEEPVSSKLQYYLRVRSLDFGRIRETIYPLKLHGELQLKNVRLSGLDLVANINGQLAVVGLELLIKKFEVRTNRTEISGGIQAVPPTYLSNHESLDSKDLTWLSPAYTDQLSAPVLDLGNSVDASLTMKEILSGGKVISLKRNKFVGGEYLLAGQTKDRKIELDYDYGFMKKRADEAEARALELMLKNQESKKGKIFNLVLLLLLGFLLLRYTEKWLPWVDRQLGRSYIFWGMQAVLWSAAAAKILYQGPRGASEGGVILILIYAVLVRYKLRKLLSRTWTLFSERKSSAYFMGFLAILPFCLLMLISKLQFAAEFWAMIGFYLLVLGLAIEFVTFAKSATTD